MNKDIHSKTELIAFLHHYFDLGRSDFENIDLANLQTAWISALAIGRPAWPQMKSKLVATPKLAFEQFKNKIAPNHEAVTFIDENYPTKLLNLASAPPVLYYQGEISLLNQSSVCIVGTRKASPVGRITAKECTQTVVRVSELPTVSGLARGIDYEVHKTTLEEKGKTIAIIGSGLGRLYPKEHAAIAKEIIDTGGLLLSPYPTTAPPLPYYFPRRNRLMVQLSDGVICVEGGPKSGSQITAKLSLEMGKTTCVFTQDYRSDFGRGAIELIRLGAEPVTDMRDLLEKLAFTSSGKIGLFPEKKRAFSVHDFAKSEELSLHKARVELSKRELAGTIQQIGRGIFFEEAKKI